MVFAKILKLLKLLQPGYFNSNHFQLIFNPALDQRYGQGAICKFDYLQYLQ
jgi:hypothetical protein